MGADRWDICPRCQHLAERDQARKRANLEADYGKIPATEYLQRAAALDEFHEAIASLREDWEIGTDCYGSFMVRYSCRCDECGFEFAFKHDQGLEVSGPND